MKTAINIKVSTKGGRFTSCKMQLIRGGSTTGLDDTSQGISSKTGAAYTNIRHCYGELFEMKAYRRS